MNKEKTILIIIDPQRDFIDSPERNGSLAVTGAYQDMLNVAKRIQNNPPDDIVVTLDSHAKMHIAHPMWWVNENGKNPDIFTVISDEDIEKRVWKTADFSMQEHSLKYVQQLKKQGKYELRIWPYHCIVGEIGHKVEPILMDALNNWEKETGKKVNYIRKGTNPKTEHYSVFKAEVVIEEDPNTKLNIKLINKINSYDKNEWAGEASSHCLGGSLLDYLNNIPKKDILKTFLLEDCTSPVTGYENAHKDLINELNFLGVNIIKTNNQKISKVKNK